MMAEFQSALGEFKKRFHQDAKWFAQAPGRVNLIGDHTDYNGGFVFPAAISYSVRLLASLANGTQSRVYSKNFDELWTGSIRKGVLQKQELGWLNYVLAVVSEFHDLGTEIPELDLYIEGNVPRGAGLSSSAALEVAAGVLFDGITDSNVSRKEIALLAQRAENGSFVGVNCGIMDQYASAFGKKDHAILLDCHSMEHEEIPFPSDKFAILIINSMKSRGLVDSEYNTRRAQCEDGLREMNQLSGKNYESLRHIPMEDFKMQMNQLDKLVMHRVRHNLSENKRVKEIASLLDSSTAELGKKIGGLLYESHVSLRDDFEVSCRELDVLVEIAMQTEGVFGCRMTGGGFGGCCVALVETTKANEANESIKAEYRAQTGVVANSYLTHPSEGAFFKAL